MDDIIYRYATPRTALGMLESQELWFTDITKMNDRNEYSCGYRVIERIIYGEYPDKTHILELISPSRINSDFSILICSFSQDGDSLSMWRGYGGHGGGIAIGYSQKDIGVCHLAQRYMPTMSRAKGKVLFFKIDYKVDLFTARVKKQLERSRRPNPNPSMSDDEFNTFKDKELCFALVRFCTLYKNDFFADEREVRGFLDINEFTDSYTLAERNIYNEQSRYHKFCTTYAGHPAIKEIVLGPTNKNSESSLRKRLAKLGLEQVAIRRSRGTYR